MSILMDKIWNPQGWPKPLFANLPLSCFFHIILEYIKPTTYTITQFTFPPKFIEYLISICNDRSVSVQIIQLTLSIASRYMVGNSKFSEPTQLVLLVSLFLAGKAIGNCDGTDGAFSLNELHKYSNHSFTNKDFYQLEKKIWEGLGFDLLKEGTCDRQVKTVLMMMKEILTSPDHYELLCKIAQDIQILLWFHIFTRGQKQNKFLRRTEKSDKNQNSQFKCQNLLTAAIIQSALVLCTHCVGRFPETVWMIHILNVKEDQVSLCVQEVLKILLGRQKFEQFKI